MGDRILYRANFDSVVREVSDDKPFRATFVAATERAVPTMSGPEILDMDGVQLERFLENPVILDTHDRTEAAAVVGRAVDVRTENNELVMEIEFAGTDRAQNVAELVRTGFLNAVSVGFAPNASKTVRLEEGKRDGRFSGPAILHREWELLETSVVPVPADAGALARRSLCESLIKEDDMEKPADKTPTRAELALEKREYVMALCPKGLEGYAENLLLQDKGEDEIRAALLERHAEVLKPVGTPEPTTTTADESGEDISNDLLLRSLRG